jgi:chromosome segregation ATPase
LKLIEQAIFSCIGFLLAALLAVAAAPGITRRARRLAEARARLLAPLTEVQAIAERDALRAQHAVDHLRLEQRLSEVENLAARRQIEIGRQSSRIVALEDLSAARAAEIGALREEFGALEREARDLRGQLGAAQLALRDLMFEIDSSAPTPATSQARRLDPETFADQNRMKIAVLETRALGLEVRLADSERAAAAAARAGGAERARLAAELNERTAEAKRLGEELDAATTEGAKLAADLATTRARLGEAEALLSRSEAAREEALIENARQFARIAERDAALREAGAAKRDLADRLSALAAAHAIAEGALLAERAKHAERRREVDPAPARVDEASPSGRVLSDQALRKAIARLGREMTRLNGRPHPAAEEPSNLVSFDRREAHAHPAGSSEPLHSASAGAIRQGPRMAPER